MKNKFLKLLTISLLVCATLFTLSACEEKHTHLFDKQVATEDYFCSAAACQVKAKYYLSCACGEKGSETFEYGNALEHSFTNYVYNNDADYEKDGTKTATCDNGCGTTDTINADCTKLDSKIAFKTLSVDGKNASAILPNASEEFSFAEEIEIIGIVTFEVSSDKYGSQTFLTKTVPLNVGDNTFYVFEMEDGKITDRYTVNIRRRPNYTVSFNSNGGSAVESQTVEEGLLATKPDDQTRVGCSFDGWDFDFKTPITINTTINAKWTVKEEMQLFEFMSTSTICEITGIKDKTATNIIIPDYITSIGDRAFSACSSLTKVNYTGTIDQWVEIDFNGYYSNPLFYVENLYINDVLVTDVILTTATKISNYAFYGCSRLQSVTIGSSVTSIGNYAFRDCSSLQSVTIGNSVTSIGDLAFADCTSLQSIIIPNSVTSIGGYAFYGCSRLKNIVIPDSVTSIDNHAFRDCSSLQSITIPDSVTSIGGYAFCRCSSLQSVTIPDSVTSIGNYAFWCCDSLQSIVIPDSVTSIGEYAFSDCDSLQSIVIPDSVTSIGEYAFRYCSRLTIYCKTTSEPLSWDLYWNSSNSPVVWGYKG